MLPFEDEVRHEIGETFRKEFADSRDLLRLALDMLGCDGGGNVDVATTPVAGVGDWARSLALGLYSKACKQFRAIILLGEAGFGGEVTVLTRAMFETVLAIEFLMREQVVLKKEGVEVQVDPSRPLTTDFRAQLYGARVARMAEKRLKDWGNHPELKACVPLLGDPARVAAEALAAKSTVGEKWWKALKVGPAGLTVKDLADSLGVTAYYALMYGDQSEVAHAGDAFSHFSVEDESNGSLELSPTPHGISRGVRLACLVFLSCLTSVHNRLPLGPNWDSALDAFAVRIGVPT